MVCVYVYALNQPIRWMLQAQLLRHHQLSMHGSHSVAGMREQVRLLLAPPQEPGGHRVALEGRRPFLHRRGGHLTPQGND